MVRMTMNELNAELTAEELREREAAESSHPVFDNDSPAMTVEQLMQWNKIKDPNEITTSQQLKIKF